MFCVVYNQVWKLSNLEHPNSTLTGLGTYMRIEYFLVQHYWNLYIYLYFLCLLCRSYLNNSITFIYCQFCIISFPCAFFLFLTHQNRSAWHKTCISIHTLFYLWPLSYHFVVQAFVLAVRKMQMDTMTGTAVAFTEPVEGYTV